MMGGYDLSRGGEANLRVKRTSVTLTHRSEQGASSDKNMVQLPHLNALRTFEVVARRGSFKAASDELCVTQSAVSQQVKNLEEHMGRKLFIRQPGKLVLTAAAERLLPAIQKAIHLIGDALEDISAGHRGVRVYASTSFALRWLMPRLVSLETKQPNITAQISVGDKADLSVEMIDLEIVYSIAPVAEQDALHLLDEWVIPVCSPYYRSEKLYDCSTLTDMHLLLNSPDGKDWRLWSRANDLESDFERASKTATRLSTDTSAIELALSGFGVALVYLHYAARHINEGRLVPASSQAPQRLGAHYVIGHTPPNPTLRLVLKWLQDEASNSHGLIHPLLE